MSLAGIGGAKDRRDPRPLMMRIRIAPEGLL
jgi:hypothetical protein